MKTQRLVGAVSRTLPRGHNPFEGWLKRHPGDRELIYRDADRLWRRADLRDDLERGWFAGLPIGLPKHVLRRIPPGTLAIDIGANVGTVAGQIAVRLSGFGRVWAIEPIPRNVARLAELIERNGLPIDALPVAAGATDGEVTLRLAEAGHSGWASVTASWNRSGQLIVPVRSIDSLMAERCPSWPVSFLKLDVEGYEAEVIKGARETLAVWRPLVYAEFNDLLLRDRGSSSTELLNVFAGAGYRPARAYQGRVLEGRVIDLLLEPGP